VQQQHPSIDFLPEQDLVRVRVPVRTSENLLPVQVPLTREQLVTNDVMMVRNVNGAHDNPGTAGEHLAFQSENRHEISGDCFNGDTRVPTANDSNTGVSNVDIVDRNTDTSDDVVRSPTVARQGIGHACHTNEMDRAGRNDGNINIENGASIGSDSELDSLSILSVDNESIGSSIDGDTVSPANIDTGGTDVTEHEIGSIDTVGTDGTENEIDNIDNVTHAEPNSNQSSITYLSTGSDDMNVEYASDVLWETRQTAVEEFRRMHNPSGKHLREKSTMDEPEPFAKIQRNK
jgi:hypothetical protein